MVEKCEIMRKVQKGLNSLKVAKDEKNEVWTREVKTQLCKIGKCLGYSVYASGVDKDHRHGGEWLYDVTWLEYKCIGDPRLRSFLTNAHLVAECEWGGSGDICDDFEKLLLARASMRLMIFDGDHFNQWGSSSTEFAEQLAERVRKFNGRLDEDAWLLAAWERRIAPTNPNDWWRFKYFTIDEKGGLQQLS